MSNFKIPEGWQMICISRIAPGAVITIYCDPNMELLVNVTFNDVFLFQEAKLLSACF